LREAQQVGDRVARYSSRGAKAGWEGAAMLDGRVADAVLGGHGAVGEDDLVGQASMQRVQVPQRSVTAAWAMSFSSDVSRVPMNV